MENLTKEIEFTFNKNSFMEVKGKKPGELIALAKVTISNFVTLEEIHIFKQGEAYSVGFPTFSTEYGEFKPIDEPYRSLLTLEILSKFFEMNKK